MGLLSWLKQSGLADAFLNPPRPSCSSSCHLHSLSCPRCPVQRQQSKVQPLPPPEKPPPPTKPPPWPPDQLLMFLRLGFKPPIPTVTFDAILLYSHSKEDAAGDDPGDLHFLRSYKPLQNFKGSLEVKAVFVELERAWIHIRVGNDVKEFGCVLQPPPEPPPYYAIVLDTLLWSKWWKTKENQCGNDSRCGANGILFQPTTALYIVTLTCLGDGTSCRASRLLWMESIGSWREIHNGSAVASRISKSIVMIYHSPRPPELAVGEEDVKKGKLSWLSEEHQSDNQGKESQPEQKEETYPTMNSLLRLDLFLKSSLEDKAYLRRVALLGHDLYFYIYIGGLMLEG